MILILNFKTYTEASGQKAVDLARIASAASDKYGIKIIVCPQAADIYRVREHFPHLSIWSQHIDPVAPGRNTGWTSPATLVMAGANGTLINHSEHKLTHTQIQSTVQICKQFQLTSCIAVPDIANAAELVTLNPDFLAYEPEDLIAGDKSLIETDLDSAKLFIKNNHGKAKLILGAGVRDSQDIRTAMEIGYDGVLMASGFVKADDPEKYLADLLT